MKKSSLDPVVPPEKGPEQPESVAKVPLNLSPPWSIVNVTLIEKGLPPESRLGRLCKFRLLRWHRCPRSQLRCIRQVANRRTTLVSFCASLFVGREVLVATILFPYTDFTVSTSLASLL